MSERLMYCDWYWYCSLSLSAVVVFCVPGPSSAQMIVEDFEPSRHERFVDDRDGAEFVGTEVGIDLSGVGRVNEGPGRWVTMISPTHFLTSNHATAKQGTVTFYSGNDLAGPTMNCEIEPASGRRIGDTDVWLGSLVSSEACDTSSLKFYTIASPGDYAGREAFAVGRSNRTQGARTTNMRAGKNRISYVETGTFFRGSADHIVFVDDADSGDVSNSLATETGSELVDSEFRVANGDSGGPSFIQSVTGDFELIGIHSYLGYDGTWEGAAFTPLRWASVDTYLPTARNTIYDELKLDDPSFVFVRNLDDQPVGEVADRGPFVIESGLDCNLDGRVNVEDFNCTTWSGSLVDISGLLNQFDVPLGDIDLDGTLGFAEFLRLTSNFGQPGQYTDGDFNLDGIIDFSDFLILTRNFRVDTRGELNPVPLPEPSGNYGLWWAVIVWLGIRHVRIISR